MAKTLILRGANDGRKPNMLVFAGESSETRVSEVVRNGFRPSTVSLVFTRRHQLELPTEDLTGDIPGFRFACWEDFKADYDELVGKMQALCLTFGPYLLFLGGSP